MNKHIADSMVIYFQKYCKNKILKKAMAVKFENHWVVTDDIDYPTFVIKGKKVWIKEEDHGIDFINPISIIVKAYTNKEFESQKGGK